MKYTGKIVSTADYTWTHSIVDIDGMGNLKKLKFIFLFFYLFFRSISPKHALNKFPYANHTCFKMVIIMDTILVIASNGQ
jgi:hypothetical protein